MPPKLAHLGFWGWMEPQVLVVSLLVAGLYLLVVDGPLGRAFPDRAPVPAAKQVAFVAAMLVVYAGFGGPLDVLADGYLFSAHMLQHVLEAMAAAPLLLIGTPDWLIRPLLRKRVTGWLLWKTTGPVQAIAIFNVIFALAFWPGFYTLMEVNGFVHFGYHAILLIASLIMWWPLLSPLPELPRLHPGLQILYVFLDGLPMLVPGAIVGLTYYTVYSFYNHTPRLFGFSQLGDQQFGGILCIVSIHLVLGAAFIVAFRKWVREERANRALPTAQSMGDFEADGYVPGTGRRAVWADQD